MALILEMKKKTWQEVTVKAPGNKGFKKQTFDAQFEIPDGDDFKEKVNELTVEECLALWLVGAKRLQLTEDDDKTVEFSDEIKSALIKTPWIRGALWETFQNVLSGGRLKN